MEKSGLTVVFTRPAGGDPVALSGLRHGEVEE